jgi:hypothetical protein
LNTRPREPTSLYRSLSSLLSPPRFSLYRTSAAIQELPNNNNNAEKTEKPKQEKGRGEKINNNKRGHVYTNIRMYIHAYNSNFQGT